MSGWNAPGWNNPYGYGSAGGQGFGGGGFGSTRAPAPSMGGMYNMWGPYGGNQMGMVRSSLDLLLNLLFIRKLLYVGHIHSHDVLSKYVLF